MRQFSTAWAVAGLFALFVLSGAGVFWYASSHKNPEPPVIASAPEEKGPIQSVLGTSVEGRAITAYTYGSGPTHLVFVGGIHGGYEWNSVLLAYQFKDYLDANPTAIPANERITVILDANPDAVFSVVGKEDRFTVADVPKGDVSYGRFNADKVDLNRNFDCNWKPTGTWQNKTVSAGSTAFSEPEAVAIRDYALREKPDAFVFWHSAAGGVYASQCNDGILPKTLDIMNAYANASKYPAIKTFDAYAVNGASEDWLASVSIPAITVELQSHETVEWDRNLAGALALFKYFDQGIAQ